MTKLEFLSELRDGLRGLEPDEIEDRLRFYSDMIDDRTEEGLKEAEAVEEIGLVEEVIAQIMTDVPVARLLPENRKHKLKVWEIILLALGSPIWLSLLIAAFAILFSLLLALWSVMAALWAVDLAFVVCAVAMLPYLFIYLKSSRIAGAVCALGAGLTCAGLAILMFILCRGLLKLLYRLTKKILIRIRMLFSRRNAA